MAFKLKNEEIKKIVGQLKNSATMHAKQAKKLESGMKLKSPMKGKISEPCKRAAKRKFKVWPSAYASGWGVRCTRNPSKYLGRKKKK